MYVILTSKSGEFRTEIGDGFEPIEAYDYHFYGRPRAHFVIASISGDPKVTIVDEAPPPTVNVIPSKFLPKFETLEDARRELQHLATTPSMDVTLTRVPT
jgi:hypothetical protein